MKEEFSIEEIKNYLKNQDSFGGAMYNLSPSNIRKANKKMSFTYQEILDSGNWDSFCDKYGINEWCIKESIDKNVEIDILIIDAKKWNLI